MCSNIQPVSDPAHLLFLYCLFCFVFLFIRCLLVLGASRLPPMWEILVDLLLLVIFHPSALWIGIALTRTNRPGLITTTQVTHASPAGVYAHIANRNWESNQQLLNDGGDPKYCMDIAKQLVYGSVGKKLKVSTSHVRPGSNRLTDLFFFSFMTH